MLKLIFRLLLDSSQYRRELKDVGRTTNKTGRDIDRGFGRTLGRIFTAGVLAKGLQVITRSILEQAKSLRELRREYSLTTQQATKLQELANMFGADPQTMAKVIQNRGGKVAEELDKQPNAFGLDDTDLTRIEAVRGFGKKIWNSVIGYMGKELSAKVALANKLAGITPEQEARIVANNEKVQQEIAAAQKNTTADEKLGKILPSADSLKFGKGSSSRASIGAFVGGNPFMESVMIQRRMEGHLRKISEKIDSAKRDPAAAYAAEIYNSLGIRF